MKKEWKQRGLFYLVSIMTVLLSYFSAKGGGGVEYFSYKYFPLGLCSLLTINFLRVTDKLKEYQIDQYHKMYRSLMIYFIFDIVYNLL